MGFRCRRSPREHSSGESQSVARAVQVGVLFLRRGCVLEPGRCRHFGFMINPPIALYYMRALTRPRACAWCALWRVRHVWSRVDAVLLAGDEA